MLLQYMMINYIPHHRQNLISRPNCTSFFKFSPSKNKQNQLKTQKKCSLIIKKHHRIKQNLLNYQKNSQ